LSAAGDAIAARMAERMDRWGQAAYRSIPWSPVVDGEVLPATPWRGLADGAARGIDLLVGHTRNEHRLFSALEGRLGEVTEAEVEGARDRLAPGTASGGR